MCPLHLKSLWNDKLKLMCGRNRTWTQFGLLREIHVEGVVFKDFLSIAAS
jgi:hypothetical protein